MKDTPGLLGLDPAFEITPESLTKLVETIAAKPAEASRTLIMIRRAPFPPGLSVSTLQAEIPKKEAKQDDGSDPVQRMSPNDIFRNLIQALNDENTPANAEGMIQMDLSTSENERRSATWWLAGGKAELKKNEEEEASPFDTLAELKKSDDNCYLRIQTLTRADAKALTEASESSILPDP